MARLSGRLRGLSVATLAVLSCLVMDDASPGGAQSGRTPAKARHHMVASSHYLGTEVGQEILRQGGNAVDAAVATAFALAVVLPSAGNIGGGGFLVFHGADGEVTAFDFREKAPLAATETLYLDDDGVLTGEPNHEGILSVGVPGTVAGLWLAHQRLGSKPWAELIEPAVALARDGVPSTWAMQSFLEEVRKRAEDWPATAAAFLKPGNELYEPGEIWRQPDLARTLERIRDDGRDGFYKGETARLLDAFMREQGGLITLEDLAAYKAVERRPIHGTYRGYDVYGMPPPSSGGIALVTMLNVLEAYDLKALGHNSAAYVHLLTETMRRAFRDRALHLGDPEWNPEMPVARLTSREHAAQLRASIDPQRATASAVDESFELRPESEETTHFSVVDAEGNAVALTYTLEYSYGSRLVAAGAGFLLNNEMGDFNPVPGDTNTEGRIGTTPNLIAPSKRMLSSMTPTIVARDGRPVLVVGSPGGRTIINTTLQVILNVLDHGMNIGAAVAAGRIHHQWFPDELRHEEWALSPDTVVLLEGRGHQLESRRRQGAANAIRVLPESGLLEGAADSRSFDARASGN